MYNYKILYLDDAKYNIFFFVESLKTNRKKRFINTWLEKLLLAKSFFDEIDKFYDEIFKFIENKLSTWFIWEIQEETEEYYQKKIVLDIRSYVLVLNCKQYLNEKVILVEDVIIS
jgi:hypothetical protein